jgi:hypothetical protein
LISILIAVLRTGIPYDIELRTRSSVNPLASSV